MSLFTTTLVLCAAYAAICGVLIFVAELLFDFFTVKRGWIGSFLEGGGMTYETRAQRFWRRAVQRRRRRKGMLKAIIIRWYRRIQLKALAAEYERMASRAERLDYPDAARECRRKAACFREQARHRNPRALPRFVVP